MLKKILSIVVVAGTAAIFSCQMEEIISKSQIPQTDLDKIASLGFSTNDVQLIDEGYLVEGDIILPVNTLYASVNRGELRIAEVEQYHTFNLVTGIPRTIRVGTSGKVPTSVSNAINAAIARYNSENLGLTFQRVSSGADITVKIVNGGSYIASAGFPTSSGDPYGTVNFNKRYAGYSQGFLPRCSLMKWAIASASAIRTI